MQSHIAAGILALALVGAAPAFAQDSQTAKNPPQKSKKVWTNEDLADLSGATGVTTASVTPAQGAAQGVAQAEPGKDKPLPPEKDPKVYRAKLGPLRKQLADVEARIKETQDAIDKPIDGTNKIKLGQAAPSMRPQDQPPGYDDKRPNDALYGNQIVRPQDQLATYEKRRQELQQQIDDLEAQARKNGIDPGDIR